MIRLLTRVVLSRSRSLFPNNLYQHHGVGMCAHSFTSISLIAPSTSSNSFKSISSIAPSQSSHQHLNQHIRSMSSKGNLGSIFRDPSAIPNGEFLEKFTQDLTKQAEEGKLDPVIGREDEIRRTLQVLSRRRKNNPVLIGEAGVGKTAIAEGLAQRIYSSEVPESIKGKRVLSLDVSTLVSGAKYMGEFEERLNGVLSDLLTANAVSLKTGKGGIILFIDEIHTLVGAGAAGSSKMDAAQILKPALARGELHIVGATTLDEYNIIEKDPALARRFQSVFVDEPGLIDTISILRGLKGKYEVHHGVGILDSALIAAARLSTRYVTDRKQPDKSIDLIDEAAARLKLQQESKPEPIYNIERAILTKRIEVAALMNDKDDNYVTKQRMEKLKDEVKKLDAEMAKLVLKWDSEKRSLGKTKLVKEELEKAKADLVIAQKRSDFAMAGQLLHAVIPKLQEELNAEERLGPIKKIERKDMMLADVVTADMIAEVISRNTGIPIEKLKGGQQAKLLDLEQELRKRVVGQEHVLEKVADCVRLNRTHLQSEDRPQGVFLFLGPTGVGKTELSKALAQVVFDDEKNSITRIDMSEYMEKFSVSRLIGAPPGYVGYEEGGILTEAVRRRPYQIILFDEFEKAHRDVWNILLQVFDEGTLTDSKGRKIDFRSTIIIMTSNLGSDIISQLPAEMLGSEPEVVDKVMNLVRQEFSPELLNRIDETLIFNRLQRDSMKDIVDIQMSKIQTRLLEGNNRITLTVTDGAKEVLGDEGFDVRYGARPLKRTIQSEVLTPLSKMLLKGDVGHGGSVRVEAGVCEDSGEPCVNLVTVEGGGGGRAVVSTDEEE